MGIWTRKPISGAYEGAGKLKRTLGPTHLVALGVGAIVGTGIYTLIGEAAGLAGPGVILSFLIAGAVCACVALCYGELASMMPASGSAYTYSYVAIGELAAWVIGWALILEYSVVTAAVASGWSGYAVTFLGNLGIQLPQALSMAPHAGGIINIPAVLIVFVVAGMLCIGTRESALVNTVLVFLKVGALLLFIALALPAFNSGHFEPFMPEGFAAKPGVDGRTVGVMAASAIIFFAFYGFDAVSTAAEEAKNPGRDLAIGVIGSMVICTALYVLVAAAAIGAVPVGDFAKDPAPLAFIIRSLGYDQLATVIAGVAVVAMPTVLLAFLYGQSRIFFVMARDKLMPKWLAAVNEKRGAPVVVTLVTAALVSVLAGLLPLGEIAALANAGTLAAFIAVGVSLMILRTWSPETPRPYRTPMAWLVAPAAILGCIYLFFSLPPATQGRFFIWMFIGLAVYGVMHVWRQRKTKPSPA